MANVKIIFATITGNNEEIADVISESLENKNFTVDVEEISQADAFDLENFDAVVVCPYTYDGGSLPEEGLDFFDDLEEVDLTGKFYAVAGSGDEFYGDDFCVAVDKFDAQLAKSGATKATENIKINFAPDTTEDIDNLDRLAADLSQKLGF